MNYDIIIIGAGLGGLTAGAKLAKEGKKVLVIEQHSKPGGCATTFKRGDYTLEVGLHEMDGPLGGDMKTRIFNDLGVFNKVKFIKVPEFYHFFNGRHKVTIPHDPNAAIEILSKLFPEETKGIMAYFSCILAPRKKNQSDEKEIDMSVGEYLDSIIYNDDLKLILLGNLGYFHDDPYSLSLFYYSVSQGSYFLQGASFIREGSQKLSDFLSDFIIDHGGDVVLNHIVTDIIISGSKATGVSYRKKNQPKSEQFIASGEEIIINSSVPDLDSMLPEKQAGELKNNISGLVTGTSLLTMYFGFRKPLRALGNAYYSTFVYDETVRTLADISKNNKDDFTRRSFTFVDYGQIDSGLAPEGKSVGSLCCIDYLKDWENLSPEEYRSEKERVAKIFIERLDKIIPGMREAIEYYEVGTSRTVKRYTLNRGGATHGFTQPPGKRSTEYIKSIDNLHIASAWGKTGGGFSGVIYGGYLCALGIMRKKSATRIEKGAPVNTKF